MDIDYFNSLMVGIGLVTVSMAIVALLIGFGYYLFRQESRISKLEAQFSALWEQVTRVLEIVPRESSPSPGGNDADKE